MQTRTLGQLEVSALGLGCMGMSFAYGGAPEAASTRTIHRAIDSGVSFLDTAEVYGPYANEELVGRAIEGRRSKVQVATKFGFKILDRGHGVERMVGVDSRPSHVRQAVLASLKRLGVDEIDLLYQHRVDPAVPIEDVVGAMADLVREGKVRHLGLSEVSVTTLRRAHAVHPIAAVQSEYSIWSRDPEDGMLEACRGMGIGFVPYSPLGRGFLAGRFDDANDLAVDDFRRTLPRFQPDAIARNRLLLRRFRSIADEKGCTPAQLALAWVLHQGESIVPIPGARTIEHLDDNVGAVGLALTDLDLSTVREVFAPSDVTGARYPERELRMVDG